MHLLVEFQLNYQLDWRDHRQIEPQCYERFHCQKRLHRAVQYANILLFGCVVPTVGGSTSSASVIAENHSWTLSAMQNQSSLRSRPESAIPTIWPFPKTLIPDWCWRRPVNVSLLRFHLEADVAWIAETASLEKGFDNRSNPLNIF